VGVAKDLGHHDAGAAVQQIDVILVEVVVAKFILGKRDP
jgi:hypothetical protein